MDVENAAATVERAQAQGDLPADLAERVDAIQRRVDGIESTLAEMRVNDVPVVEIEDEDPGGGASIAEPPEDPDAVTLTSD